MLTIIPTGSMLLVSHTDSTQFNHMNSFVSHQVAGGLVTDIGTGPF